MASTSKKTTLRVLCLHGFRANVQVMKDQMRALHKSLGADTEFVYLNGPFEAEGKAFPGVEEFYKDSRPFYEWTQYYIGDDKESTVLTPAQIKELRERVGEGNHWVVRYGGMEKALEYLDEKLEKLGPFDIALGFSQGAQILTLYSMWCLQNYNKRVWKLLVVSNTTRINGMNAKYLFVAPDGKEILIPFPSVHLIGKKDPIAEESRLLIGMFDRFPTGSPTEKVVLEHEGGHQFPSFKRNPELYAKLVEVMNQYRREDADAGATEQESRL